MDGWACLDRLKLGTNPSNMDILEKSGPLARTYTVLIIVYLMSKGRKKKSLSLSLSHFYIYNNDPNKAITQLMRIYSHKLLLI